MAHAELAACRDTESAIEASLDGRPRGGVMTDAFLEALSSLGEEQSWNTVYGRVLARVEHLHGALFETVAEPLERDPDLRPIAA